MLCLCCVPVQVSKQVVQLVKLGAGGINFDLEMPMQVCTSGASMTRQHALLHTLQATALGSDAAATCTTCQQCIVVVMLVEQLPVRCVAGAALQLQDTACNCSTLLRLTCPCPAAWCIARAAPASLVTRQQQTTSRWSTSLRRRCGVPCLARLCLLTCPGRPLTLMAGTTTGRGWLLLLTRCSSWHMTQPPRWAADPL